MIEEQDTKKVFLVEMSTYLVKYLISISVTMIHNGCAHNSPQIPIVGHNVAQYRYTRITYSHVSLTMSPQRAKPREF